MTKREEVMAAAKKAGLYVTGVPQWLEAFHAIAQLDGQRIAELEAERDNAWTELREIRAAISANPEESTLDEVVKLRQQLDTAWAQAHRLALELECLIMDTKDNAIVSKWWDSAFAALCDYQGLKPGAAEDAEAWAKMRKAGI